MVQMDVIIDCAANHPALMVSGTLPMCHTEITGLESDSASCARATSATINRALRIGARGKKGMAQINTL